MAYNYKFIINTLFYIFILLQLLNYMPCKAKLSTTFYDKTCPKAIRTIKTSIKVVVENNPRNAAFLIRLLFHDCFVQGCDASLLLEGSGSEKASLANNGVLGYEIIDHAKAAVEKVCPGVVSCADVLALAARDASVAVGGPSWLVRLGRRDSLKSNATQAATDLPTFHDSLSQQIKRFARKGLNAREMVALSGSHTIGQARCVVFRQRIYNKSSNIDPVFASSLRKHCPQASSGDENLQPLDLVTPNKFDNNYFKNLVRRKGLLISDQVLFNGDSTDKIVTEYVNNPKTFESDFAAAMVKMSEIDPITGAHGMIRTRCTRSN